MGTWLVLGGLGVDALGTTLLAAAALLLALFAVAELRLASRRVSRLLPLD